MNQSLTTGFSKIISILVAIIIILLPFHAFFTTLLGSNFNNLNVWKLWKEVILLLLIPLSLYVVLKTPKLKIWLLNDWLPRLITIYIILNLALGVWSYHSKSVNFTALIDGLITDLRFFTFFLIAGIASYKVKFLKTYWQELIIYPAMVTVIFGLAQLFLPIDFLKHFGYGPKTTLAYETVDQKFKYHRIQSTLRGPNPFGAYLILIITAALINLKKQKWFKILLIVLALIVLFFTYSRSAYLGLIVSLIGLFYLIKLKPAWHKKFLVVCVILTIIFSGLVLALRYNSVAENVFFHTDKSSKSKVSSNAQRLNAIKKGLSDVYYMPLGSGPGSAGPASVHNNHPARISENYFIQVAQETGLIGLIIFISINIIVAVRLWLLRKDLLASLLLASLLGITIVNMISHAWTDDTLSLIWWGMAGIVIFPGIIKNNKQ